MDDNILDKNSIKILLSQYGIRTRGTGKNTTVIDKIYLNRNSNGEVVPFTWDMDDNNVSADDVVSFSTLFPDGATLTAVGIMHDDELIRLSGLPKNINVQKFYIAGSQTLNMLDARVGAVVCNNAHDETLKTSSINNMSEYTDTLVILDCYPTYNGGYKGFDDILSIKNCPFKNIVWQYGARVFGLKCPKKQTVSIQTYLNSETIDLNGEPLQKQYLVELSGQTSQFAIRIKDWLKNNPNTDLFLSWGVNFEKLTMNGDKLIATKTSQAEINKLCK